MGTDGTDRILIYGDIAGREGRRIVEATHPECVEQLTWVSDPVPPESSLPPSVVFVDLDTPEFSSAEFLLSIAEAGCNVRVVGKSQEMSSEDAIHFAKLGVSEVLTPDQCLTYISACLTDDNKCSGEQKPSGDPRYTTSALIGDSPQVREIRAMINTLSDVDYPSALILGETGTGKSLICRVLHNTGLRAAHNMVEVNCSAIPDDLFESELFGHAKGAFTDAKVEKTGLFEYAQFGTLFLDEVGNLSGSAQGKLLKVIEDRTLRKVGGLAEMDVNVRIVAATNIDLHQAVHERRFREDLLHRLNLLEIVIPPLREHPEDIPALLEHYIRHYAALYRKPDVRLEDSAVAELTRYHWPGNVRELCNVVERMVLLARGRVLKPTSIRAALKRGRISAAERGQITINLPPQGVTLQQIEEEVVKQVLDRCGWNKSETAKYLGISRPRLRRIIEHAGLEQDRRNR